MVENHQDKTESKLIATENKSPLPPISPEDEKEAQKEQTRVEDYGHAAKLLFDWIDGRKAEKYGISGLSDVERIGHRGTPP